jgi:hypothetical protein
VTFLTGLNFKDIFFHTGNFRLYICETIDVLSTFWIRPDTSNAFFSGPPYEDIAFKIVNKEWEYGYKRGFRCQFHNNIFQLWFHFKRYRYRR